MATVTYLKVWFNSEGVKPSKITDMLMGMGFKPITGGHDYAYYWNKKPKIEELISLGEQVQQTLRGTGVFFKLETVGP